MSLSVQPLCVSMGASRIDVDACLEVGAGRNLSTGQDGNEDLVIVTFAFKGLSGTPFRILVRHDGTDTKGRPVNP